MLETTSLLTQLSCFSGSLTTSVAKVINPLVFLIEHLWNTQIYLYSAVSPICYDNISIRIYSYSSWCIKLPISFSIRSKLQYEFSLLVKYLYGLKQKPEYGIISNISHLLLPVHLLTKLGIEELPGTHTPLHTEDGRKGAHLALQLHYTAQYFPSHLRSDSPQTQRWRAPGTPLQLVIADTALGVNPTETQLSRCILLWLS